MHWSCNDTHLVQQIQTIQKNVFTAFVQIINNYNNKTSYQSSSIYFVSKQVYNVKEFVHGNNFVQSVLFFFKTHFKTLWKTMQVLNISHLSFHFFLCHSVSNTESWSKSVPCLLDNGVLQWQEPEFDVLYLLEILKLSILATNHYKLVMLLILGDYNHMLTLLDLCQW